jgi:hypothetical protein
VDDATGQDPDGTLSVTVGPTNRVVRIEVHRADAVRTPEALEAVARLAYRSALVAQVRDTPVTPQPGPRTAVATLARAVPLDLSQYESHQIRGQVKRSGGPRRPVAEVGHSDNGCVWVELVPASSRGVIGADPGWLSQATASQIGQSVHQAFERAYEERDR